ncbi:MAG: radical SAM protein [Alphaproteobacteria bacterium]|nr:radical SAM protein [Alphaproteobacteria bacterium]
MNAKRRPPTPTVVDRALDRAGLRRAPGRPTQVHLSVTDRCFLPCKHCDIWKNEDPDLPGHVWEDVIDRLAEWVAPASMNFVGGEPLLRKDLESLMGRAVQRGFDVSFNTNGWLVTEKRARAVAAAGVRIAYVSMDGIEKATVDHSRGRAGSWEKATTAIDRLLDAGVPRVIVATILHAGNAAEVDGLLAFVKSRGLQVVVQPLYQNFGDNDYDPDWWRQSEMFPRDEAQLAAIEGALDRLSVERLRGGPVCNAVGQLQGMKGHFRAPDQDNRHICRAGHSDISFDPQGRIRLCYFLDPVGSVFDPTPFPLMWDGLATLRRRWEVSRCDRHCNLLNCNFDRDDA